MKRETTKTTTCNRVYKILQKNFKVYCTICNRGAGIFDAYCGPGSDKKQKNWKRFRKTQYKQ
jgi:hypothetical protein